MWTRRITTLLAVPSVLCLLSACSAPETSEPRPEAMEGRVRLELEAEDRDKVLLEMRLMLEAMHGILQGLVNDDLAAVADAARGAGTAMAVDLDPAIRDQLPETFVDLGMRTHQAFDELADTVDAGGTKQDAIRELALLTGNCVGCHAGFRLDEAR